MKIAQTVAEVLDKHVVLEVESIDRMYLNLYVPGLQTPAGVAHYQRNVKGCRFASSAMVAPMSRAFVKSIERYIEREGVDLVKFKKGERKDDVTQKYIEAYEGEEGVMYVGKAQEKARVTRTGKRRNKRTGQTYPWLFDSTAMVNHYYFYCMDEDFGPFFLKFCTYFPYTAKLCFNGHEYVKRQLAKRGIEFEPLDNGIRSCADPRRLQSICDGLSSRKIAVFVRKWLRRLPHAFTAQDRRAGYHYDISILQAEFALTQVLDRPVTGRIFFEEVIRENLDIGRPSQVQLIFNRRITRKTPSRYRTRIITNGVYPSLHVEYKRARIKQYHKEGQALRTETTINDPYDFYVRKRLHNLPELRKIGFDANRRLLQVQRISHDCSIGEDVFVGMQHPADVDGQRASAMRFGDGRVQALFNALLLFAFLPRGFSNRDLRPEIAALLGIDPGQITQGKMTYDLRRLRLHGLIHRLPKTHRYRLTGLGLRVVLFYTRVYSRVLRPGLAMVARKPPDHPTKLQRGFSAVDHVVDDWCRRARLAA
jgi:hypothetical protein